MKPHVMPGFPNRAGISIVLAEKGPADHTALAKWRARVAERPSVKNRTGQDQVPEDVPYLALLLEYLNSQG